MNNRFCSSLFCVIVIFLATCVPVCGQLMDDDVERNLKLAKKYYGENNFRMALHYAQQVTQMSPGNLDAKEIIERAESSGQSSLNSSTVQLATPPAITKNSEEENLLQKWQLNSQSDEGQKAGAELAGIYLEKAQVLSKHPGNSSEVLLWLRKAAVLNNEDGWVQYELFKNLSTADRIEESLPFGRTFLELVGFGVVATDVKRKLVHMLIKTGDKYSKRSCWDKAVTFYEDVANFEPGDELKEEAFQKLVISLKTLFFQLHGHQRYVEVVPYLDQLATLRPEDEVRIAEFDRKHYWRIKKFAPDVYWEAVLELRRREEFQEASKVIESLLASTPSAALRKKAMLMKDTLLQEQVAANANSTIGSVQEAEADVVDASIVGANTVVSPGVNSVLTEPAGEN